MKEVLYTTDDLSKMFRVGKSTIKRWTDEGKLKCFKTPGGHRKFSLANVHQFINEYHYEIVTPILPFSRTSETIGTDSIVLTGQSTIEECFMCAITGKRQQIDQLFSEIFYQGKTLPHIFDSLLTPVLKLIQSNHQKGTITTVEFQIAKNTLIHSLIHFTDQIPKHARLNKELYCLSVHEGMNEVELKGVELLLDSMGLTVYNLGNVLTKYAAGDIINQCRPDDVFVVLTLDHSSDEIVQQFHRLAVGVNEYGGNVYTSNFFDNNKSEEKTVPAKQFHSFAEIAEQFSHVEHVAH